MKLLLIGLILTSTSWAKPLILVSHYDKFGKAPFNNSERIAKALEVELSKDSSPVRIKLCALETKFDVAYEQLENCVKNLGEAPAMVVGLGETACNVKIELMGRNLDRSLGPDNAGTERKNTVIIQEAPSHLGFTYPLDDMYCALEPEDRGNVFVSNSAGSFVCNNTAFQFSNYYPEIPSGFFHVPSNNCRNLAQLNTESVKKIAVMLSKISAVDLRAQRLAVGKDEVQARRQQWKGKDACRSEFWGKARGIDEKKRHND